MAQGGASAYYLRMDWINARWFGFRPLLVLSTGALGLGAAGNAILFHNWLGALVLGAGCLGGVVGCIKQREDSPHA